MRTTVDHFTAAEEVALDQARGPARAIADTLAAMDPNPAYVVRLHDEDDACSSTASGTPPAASWAVRRQQAV
ncbi:hypothetical protein [Streptomyces sp. NBC_01763]|uniref:hypothetical protein n=1 Tax=Streptomyces sp. NBC_01763 TaxID=2975934 RepID=UPI002DD8707C|nr:hypothetical protein [Streptomyces sp. NBC_01763]WSC41138.1 hypothetical protein OHA08_39825 [Streptomyces sp. NBC_01763]